MKFKNRYKGLVYASILCLVLPYFTYRLAIKETLQLNSVFNEQKKEIESLERLTKQGDKSDQFDVKNDIQQGKLLISLLQSVLDDTAVAVENYTPLVELKQGVLGMQSSSLALSGDFISLVKVIDYIEQNLKSCRLCSASFEIVNDVVSHQEKLTASIIIKQITK